MAGTQQSDIPKRYTGARDTTFARIARNNIGFLSVTDTYIHTYIHTNYRITKNFREYREF